MFTPGPISPGTHSFDVASIKSSAGSTGLVFQTVALPLFFAGKTSHLFIKGGTHVEWSPPADYIRDVFLPAVERMGVKAGLSNPLKGYYPIGGGTIEAVINPAKTPLLPLNVTERGGFISLSVLSAASNLPLSIAQRQLDRVITRLQGFGIRPEGRCAEEPSPGRGTYVFILVEYQNIKAGFSALGARGKRAEEVADEAADKFISFFNKTGAMDPHLSDQVVALMALAQGTSRVTVSEVTNHLLTNIHVIERFLPVKFNIKGRVGEEGTVSVRGCGLKSDARQD